MKIFADASYFGNAYYPGGGFAPAAHRLRNRHQIATITSVAVIVEFRLGSLWNAQNQEGWNEFSQDKARGKILEIGVDWAKLFSEFEPVVLRQGSAVRPDLLDGMHVLAARQSGATHFLSFDFRSRQRSFARAIGLKVLPERIAGEFGD